MSIQITFDAADRRLPVSGALALGYIFQPPPPGHESWEAVLADSGIPGEEW